VADLGSITVSGDDQPFFFARNPEVSADGPKIRFCPTGEIETLRFELISQLEATQAFLLVNAKKMENMRTSGFFGQATGPCPFIDSISSEIQYNGYSCLQDVDDERPHD
jgi:hypothetical protein